MKPDEQGPWAVARAFGAALTREMPDRLAAAYVVGSLAHSAFVDGISLIDVAVIVNGDRNDPGIDLAVDASRRSARNAPPPEPEPVTAIPSRPDQRGPERPAHASPASSLVPGIRCLVLGEDELRRPYSPERETVPEVLRVEDEGVRIAGSDIRASIERPSVDDYMAYIRTFDRLARDTAFRTDSDELPPYTDLYGLGATASRHHVFAKEHLVIWPKHDVLLAFCMGHDGHPGAETARMLTELGPTPPESQIPPDVGDRVRTFWFQVHDDLRTRSRGVDRV